MTSKWNLICWHFLQVKIKSYGSLLIYPSECRAILISPRRGLGEFGNLFWQFRVFESQSFFSCFTDYPWKKMWCFDRYLKSKLILSCYFPQFHINSQWNVYEEQNNSQQKQTNHSGATVAGSQTNQRRKSIQRPSVCSQKVLPFIHE